MADEADLAQLEIDNADANARAKRAMFDLPSRSECIDCDDPIPEARQRLGGVTRCIDCQSCEDKRL